MLHIYQSNGIDLQYESMSTVTLVVDDTLTQLQIGLGLSGFGKLWGGRFLEDAPRNPIEP